MAIDPQRALARYVATHRSQAAAARALGVSASYLHDMLHGQRAVARRVLAHLGLQRGIVRIPKTAIRSTES